MMVGIRRRNPPRFSYECSICGAGKVECPISCPECTKEKWADVNHYHWLEEHLWGIMAEFGVDPECNRGIIVAHADKCSGYRNKWEQLGIPFPHGVALYLLSYCSPFSSESRETENGWVDPGEWVCRKYYKFFRNGVDI